VQPERVGPQLLVSVEKVTHPEPRAPIVAPRPGAFVKRRSGTLARSTREPAGRWRRSHAGGAQT
jgi:hypothetical protein